MSVVRRSDSVAGDQSKETPLGRRYRLLGGAKSATKAVASRDAQAKSEPPPLCKPWKIVCISLYQKDIERLERIVRLARGAGYSGANKSSTIRDALAAYERIIDGRTETRSFRREG